ncbi:MAG: (Fe-S)-binding protein [Planctomycetota bacterium]
MSALPGLDDCVHCGLCLPVCPTYAIDRRESQNPRGRIAALRAIEEGRSAPTPGLLRGLDDCLVCRACESACPSGISMEGLMMEHRSRTSDARSDGRTVAERWFLRAVVSSPGVLDRFRGGARLGRSRRPAALPPDTPGPPRLRPARAASPPAATSRLSTETKGRAVLLRGCIADRVQDRETRLAARLLSHFGFEVSISAPGCCGALQRHSGLVDLARELSLERARDLLSGEPDAIVVDSAGCGSALHEPLSDAPELHAVAERGTDTPSLLATIGLPPPPHPIPGPVVFAPPCHQSHGTRSTEATRSLLEHITEGEVVLLPGEEQCCGAAGTYFLRRPAKSRQLGERAKERWERGGRVKTLATGNPGCLLRWESLLRREPGVEVAHPVTLAARAYGLESEER